MSRGYREPPAATPPAPRHVTADIESDAARHGKALRIFGGVWSLVGLALGAGLSIAALASGVRALAVQGPIWTGIAVVAAIVWLFGWQRKRKAVEVFRNGVEASATVVDVKQNTMMRVNGRNPWDVTYEYASASGKHRGMSRYWGERPEAEAGDPVTVLHDPDAPARSVLWTRLDPGSRRHVRVDDAEARVAALEARLASAEARLRIAEPAPEDEARGNADDADAAQEAEREAQAGDGRRHSQAP